MRMYTFARRVTKEIFRDPLTVFFGLGFPLVLLLLFSAIQANVPVSLFEPESITPGIAVFGLAFMTLFSANLIAKDRESALLRRLYTTPLTPADYILGYMLPILPIALLQSVICYGFALPLGLDFSMNLLLAVVFIIPVSIMYIAMGLLFGSILNVKQVGGVCGALLTNLSAWLSGVWFDVALVGGAFERIANLLPFIHAAELQRGVVSGDFSAVIPHLAWVLGYGIALTAIAVYLFLRQMKKT